MKLLVVIAELLLVLLKLKWGIALFIAPCSFCKELLLLLLVNGLLLVYCFLLFLQVSLV
jgi:hypothetical protein